MRDGPGDGPPTVDHADASVGAADRALEGVDADEQRSGDLDVTVAYLQQQGIKFEQEPRDEKWGWREARLRDPAGNAIRLYQAGEMRRFPPWRVEDA